MCMYANDLGPGRVTVTVQDKDKTITYDFECSDYNAAQHVIIDHLCDLWSPSHSIDNIVPLVYDRKEVGKLAKVTYGSTKAIKEDEAHAKGNSDNHS